MSVESERQLELLAKVTRELMENQMHVAMVLASLHDPQAPLSPILTGNFARGLSRMAEILDDASELDFPSDLAKSLHTTALRLRDLGGREAEGGS